MSEPTEPAVPEDRQLHFPGGIPGFPQARRFALRDLDDDGTFQLLRSLDQPGVEIVVGVPWLFFPDYSPELSDADRQGLGIERPEDATVFCAVTADPDEDRLYLNLLAPFVVNVGRREGRQVVLTQGDQPLRAPVRVES